MDESDLFASKLARWVETLPRLTHYELLGVERDASPKDAFHAFSEHFHPDRHPQAGPSELRALRKIYQAGSEAYRVLRDPKMRAAYDLELARRRDEGVGPGARSLPDLCATKGGQLHARQAERALGSGELVEARDLLRKALAVEGDNAELRKRLEALDVALFLSGR